MNKGKRTIAVLACLLIGCLVSLSASSAVAADNGRAQIKYERVRELLAQGMTAYRNNDIETAVAKWREVLLIDPSNRYATNYLKEVAGTYEKVEADKKLVAEKTKAEADAARKVDEKVSIEVKENTKLRDFLNTLSFVTGINFVIVRGADMPVMAKFEDVPLRDILDSVLVPNGLNWTRRGDVITIVPNLRTRMFPLNSDVLVSVRRLYETNDLQKILWNADTPPIPGIELSLDDRQSALILTDSPDNIEKVRQLLANLAMKTPPKLTTRIFSIQPDLANNIKVLVEAVLRTESEPAYELERRVLVAPRDNSVDLIIRDTEDNLRKVEEMLKDKNFLRHLEQEEIEVYTVNLVPREVLRANPEQVESFGRDVKEVIETMLYHKEGVAAAQAQGRRLWYDQATLQLTLTDFPSNIKKVAEFVEALPQLEPKPRSKIIFLEYAVAGDLASQLEEVLGIGAAGVGAGAAAGNQASFSLRVEDERTFRDLSIRLIRVDATSYGGYGGGYGGYGVGVGMGMGRGSIQGTANLVVRTSTAQSSDLSIQEFRSEIFEEYEIYVEKIYPSPTPGEGRVRLRVTYRPEMGPGGTGGY